MKALAIDSSGATLYVAARNEADTVTCIYDIGLRQSETLLNAIDYVLKKVGLKKGCLDFATLCAGPGSFTSLRLSFAALKAINISWNTPIYAVPTLEAIALPYSALPFTVLPVLDARKSRFYAAAYHARTAILPAGDYTPAEILAALPTSNHPDSKNGEQTILAVGSGATLFLDAAKKSNGIAKDARRILTMPCPPATDALFTLASECQEKGAAPMQDFDGPLYLRPCDAEANLTHQN